MLTPGHREELHRSGLTDETIGRAGIYSATAGGVSTVLGYGGTGPGLVFPYPENGSAPYARVKMDQADKDGKRYRSPSKQPNRLYIPALLNPAVLADPTTPLWLTEGEKKALKACQESLACVGVSGVWSWKTRDTRDHSVPIKDLDRIVWRGRLVYIVFDSDLALKPSVKLAEFKLAQELRRRGARVRAIRLPGEPGGAKVGLDDYLLTHSVETLCALEPVAILDPATTSEPVLVRLSDVTPKPVEWCWPARFAFGKPGLLVGEPGVGKGWTTADMTARLTRRSPWPTTTTLAPDSDVVILSAEDGVEDTLASRVEQQGGDRRRVHVLTAVKLAGAEVPFNLERDVPALETALVLTRARVVFIDPLSAYLGSRDSYKDAEVRGLLAPLAAMAERFRAAIIGILHLNKDAQRRLLLRAGGSIAFVAAARTVFAIGHDPNDTTRQRRLLVCVKNNLTAFPPPLAFRIGECGLTWEPEPAGADIDADAVLGSAEVPESAESRAELGDAVAFLEKLLADGPVLSSDVLKAGRQNGLSERTLWRAKRAIKADAYRPTGQPHPKWYWMRAGA